MVIKISCIKIVKTLDKIKIFVYNINVILPDCVPAKFKMIL